jgi:hypothetical protein
MQRVSTWLEQRSESPKWKGLPKETPNLRLGITKHPKRKFGSRISPHSLNSRSSTPFGQRNSQNELDASDQKHSQVKYYLSLIYPSAFKLPYSESESCH